MRRKRKPNKELKKALNYLENRDIGRASYVRKLQYEKYQSLIWYKKLAIRIQIKFKNIFKKK